MRGGEEVEGGGVEGKRMDVRSGVEEVAAEESIDEDVGGTWRDLDFGRRGVDEEDIVCRLKWWLSETRRLGWTPTLVEKGR